ncbi:MAG TPA: outer membrane beta-barrel protein [Bacteroidales bacterium]|nr:outer membrane beta-barrel protein [Bacteroidales bacterium]
MIRSVLIFLVIIFTAGSGLKAQDCAVKLREAENSFNQGRVEEVPGLLESCLESGFTREEELSAYKLIIRSYLFDDKTDLAEQTMLEFLKKRPEYEISPTDNADFIYLLSQYRIKPVIQVGLHGGMNFSYTMGKTRQSVSGDPLGSEYNYDNGTILLGGNIRYPFNEKIEVGIEINYTETAFRYSEEFLYYGLVQYFEKQRRVETPVNVYYSPWHLGGFIPFFKGGFGAAIILSTDARSIFSNIDLNNPFENSGVNENRDDHRIRTDYMLTAGFGCKYKLPSSYIFVDVSTKLGLQNQAIPGIPTNQELYYLYTDDKFHLNSLNISMGYIYIFYKPQKITQ